MDRNQLFEKIRGVLTDCLGVDDDEVTMKATLQGDLGAESIDVLDIVFRLEKTFEIKIPRSELWPEDVLSNPEYSTGDRMNEKGLAMLKQAMPHADFSQFERNPVKSKVSEILTVETLVNYVDRKLKAA